MRKYAYALLISILTFYSHSQENLNIEPGKKYKFFMFDDTQIIGKVISEDRTAIKIETDNKVLITLSKSNILYTSNDLTPDKYSYSIGVLGGISILGGEGSYYHYNGNRSPYGPTSDLQGIFYLTPTKAIRLAFNYSYFKPKYQTGYYYSDYYKDETFSGGEYTYISFKPGFQFGQMSPKEPVLAYGTVSFGFQYSKRNQFTHSYYYKSYSDTTYHYSSNTSPEYTTFNSVISLGGGLGFRINKKFSIITEGEINLILGQNSFNTYFPFKIGLSYSLF